MGPDRYHYKTHLLFLLFVSKTYVNSLPILQNFDSFWSEKSLTILMGLMVVSVRAEM